ncbi:cell cycle control protein [Grosmannia clavigera kw1407]|uniref:Cell cycle control protein n=1 Tax=Grosmannia clavigera (strain kw1407 / UAMH 11150) TaxID=655863 RepID=F0XFL5_GROCL|nr:cell cycle control protein [Grosmannia clavigera kw1407]EFX04463.1 cell cycle control protein [Grosmannia clavigera kw1407]
MSGDLNSYIASRYLVAETKPSKKRKRKQRGLAGDGLLITDDDESGWTKGRGGGDGDDDGMGGLGPGAATVAGTSVEFRKTKKNNWKSLGGDSGSMTTKTTTTTAKESHGRRAGSDEEAAAAAAADAIISAAAADTEAALAAEDEAPVMMSDGTHAGLQSAATVTAQLERRRREEREQYEAERRERRARRREKRAASGKEDDDRSEGEEEVVYRDATGRRVDVAMRRQQVRQAVQAAEQKERAAKDALRGDVQREEARQRREMLEEAALMPVARGVDDEEMNRELKSQMRWNDPMAQFLQREEPTAAAAAISATRGAAGESSRNRSNRPVYKGPATPNRYGIRPGYRWDGVDRGNGFEAERFKAINRRERNKGLEYAWQMDA